MTDDPEGCVFNPRDLVLVISGYHLHLLLAMPTPGASETRRPRFVSDAPGHASQDCTTRDGLGG
ncbi:hypothetical protein RhoFasB10_01199 [Rhodococcus sp. B10]|uniref:Uncharacterized protein n=1 Tax=Rhodococcoides kyotonense TaxID=398843 RepID=A0A177YHL3_9NOCA|nr:hypothetical protein [Rhodococcus sp. B10]OAK54598.1 hypothetical protein A3K89_04390 [Rhodococcus kyotonensis]